jgi:hypothetical protein
MIINVLFVAERLWNFSFIGFSMNIFTPEYFMEHGNTVEPLITDTLINEHLQ